MEQIQQEKKRKRGRPKKKGQLSKKVINVRAWTFYELNNLKSSKMPTQDAIITRLIMVYKKTMAADTNGLDTVNNKNISN